ncbi:U3 small nucleolar RNA-associated protein 11 [Xylariomycetidae sp. FL2044]|nr:U3 small nucleolar RNA-associated protein 11 [Xylariomycetidae sp. FL2044]
MSSMRNAVQRRVHRERAQPKERQRLGILEKHKDYSLRAKDFNKKKAQLRALRSKAAERNEDEFYFGMMSRKGPETSLQKRKGWTGTVQGDRGNKAMDMETVRLLKTQDMGYIRTARNVAAKEVRELEERVLGLGASLDEMVVEDDDNDDDEDDDDDGFDFGDEMKSSTQRAPRPKKTVFADDVAEREDRMQVEVAGDFESEDDDEDDDDADAGVIGGVDKNPEALRAEQRQKLLEKLQRRLQHARRKVQVLARAEHELELQRARMAKTSTVGGVTKAGKKFKIRERKR